ncbi:MAG TPA: hypothetical protein VFX48_10090 [Saprospiraceae bacterium]|nr:hypothetical protein [Saprospiraceae bacterium]
MRNRFLTLLRKEFIFEWRGLYQLGGLVSFLMGVSYLVYFFSGDIQPKVWNLMYWIIFLFLSFFGGMRTYEEDNGRYKIYTHQLSSPLILFAAKTTYLFIVLLGFGLLLNIILNGLIPVNNAFGWAWPVILAQVAFGFALLTAFTSFISSHANSRQILMVVISLPLCFPLLAMAFSCTLDVLSGVELSRISSKMLPVLAIDLLALALVTILLPLSWKN